MLQAVERAGSSQQAGLSPGAPAKDRVLLYLQEKRRSFMGRANGAHLDTNTSPFVWSLSEQDRITQRTEDQLSQASSSWTTASFLRRGRRTKKKHTQVN